MDSDGVIHAFRRDVTEQTDEWAVNNTDLNKNYKPKHEKFPRSIRVSTWERTAVGVLRFRSDGNLQGKNNTKAPTADNGAHGSHLEQRLDRKAMNTSESYHICLDATLGTRQKRRQT